MLSSLFKEGIGFLGLLGIIKKISTEWLPRWQRRLLPLTEKSSKAFKLPLKLATSQLSPLRDFSAEHKLFNISCYSSSRGGFHRRCSPPFCWSACNLQVTEPFLSPVCGAAANKVFARSIVQTQRCAAAVVVRSCVCGMQAIVRRRNYGFSFQVLVSGRQRRRRRGVPRRHFVRVSGQGLGSCVCVWSCVCGRERLP